MAESAYGSPACRNPGLAEDLIDVAAVERAYYENKPDPSDPLQQVVFGTSGHRGSSLDNAFNADHILATTQAIAEYRAGAGITGPLFIGFDTHLLSIPAWRSARSARGQRCQRMCTAAHDAFTPPRRSVARF